MGKGVKKNFENILINIWKLVIWGLRYMPRRKLDRKKTEMIQVMVEPEDKAAFDAWCAAHSTTMSEVIRQQIAPFVKKGSELQRNETKPV